MRSLYSKIKLFEIKLHSRANQLWKVKQLVALGSACEACAGVVNYILHKHTYDCVFECKYKLMYFAECVCVCVSGRDGMFIIIIYCLHYNSFRQSVSVRPDLFIL